METSLASTINIEDEMRQSYLDYAMSVIVGRALPDVRDGLKPVQRRVLYAMLSEGLVSNRKHSKCAGVVGEVLKKYHPHGDASVYDALVRLAQPWNLRYPLVDGQGNFGSLDGDPAAAYRYTECRLTALAEQLLQDIEKETVDFSPNFDDSTVEPVVLPSIIPNLLVNGADGIAVGMATHIPPHNLAEVVSGMIACMENPDITIDELMKLIPGPDFPTGGIIYGRSTLRDAYTTGRGIIHIRAKTTFEPYKKKNREGEAIVIHEIPFQVNKARLMEKIAQLVNDKLIEGIADFRDESDREGLRVVVELKRDATAEVVLNQLFKLTPLQESFGIINLAIVDGKPQICSLKELLTSFADYRRDVITRRTQFDLRKAQARQHLVAGFRTALLNLDRIIALIRGADTGEQAKSELQTQFSLSETQAQAILDLRLQKLVGLERLAVEREFDELTKLIAELKAILASPSRVDEIIISEMRAVTTQFTDPRRTLITDAGKDINREDLIEEAEMVVVVSHQGYVKRTATTEYRTQGRGGKGVAGTASKEDDFTTHLFVASTHSYLLVFSSVGRVFWLKVYNVPEAGRTARGRALVNLLNLKDDEKITAILPVREFNPDRFIVMCTKQGVIKKCDLMDFSRPRTGGLIACTLKEGDSLVSVGITGGSDEILLASRNGIAIRFKESDVRPMGRSATGVHGMSLEEGDSVVSMLIAPKVIPGVGTSGEIEEVTVLTACENGYGKRTVLSEYRSQGRFGKGVIDIQTNERNGLVVSACAVTSDSQVMLITSSGKLIRTPARDISVIGRNTQGVRLIDLDDDEKVLAIAILADQEDA